MAKRYAAKHEIEAYVKTYAQPKAIAINLDEVPERYPITKFDLSVWCERYVLCAKNDIISSLCELNSEDNDVKTIQNFWMYAIQHDKFDNVRGGITRCFDLETYEYKEIDSAFQFECTMRFELIVQVFVPIDNDKGFWVDVISPKVSDSWHKPKNIYCSRYNVSQICIDKTIPINAELSVEAPIGITLTGDFNKVIHGLMHSIAYTATTIDMPVLGETDFCTIIKSGTYEFTVSFDKLKTQDSPFKNRLLSTLYIAPQDQDAFLNTFCSVTRNKNDCVHMLHHYHTPTSPDNDCGGRFWEYDDTSGGHFNW